MYDINTSSFLGDCTMYQKIAKEITNYFINKGIIKNCEKEMYEYSYEIMISQFFYIIIMLLISLIFGAILESLAFFVGFYICRKYSGGYHASTYMKCHILFSLNHILFLIILKTIKGQYVSLLTFVSVCTSVIIIFLFSPIDHPNKPFSTTEFTKYKRNSRVLAILSTLLVILFNIFDNNNILVFSFSIGIFSVGMSLLYAIIERRINRNE